MTIQIKSCREGIQFSAAIQPRASRNQILGIHNNSLKIKLTSPPVDGAANQACIKFLAKAFGISPSRVSIVKGETSRNKTIQFEAMDQQTFMNTLASLIPEAG
ncbi:MAG: DUF167 domain-containing protein [Nitrospinota bacterium]|nr:DUF167 domain-containing protein [Nitrospinota bacterium]